jgi:AcrR family transcriptional regulator
MATPNSPSGPPCARRYELRKRQEALDENRVRAIEAAKALLTESSASGFKSGLPPGLPSGLPSELTMGAVAERAGITRQTLYNRFGSRSELIETVFDELARSAAMGSMAAAMQQRDPQMRLAGMIETFGRFWSMDRAILRRIRALAATDPVLQRAVNARDERRRAACRHVVNGFAGLETGAPEPAVKDGGVAGAKNTSLLVDVLYSLTSFEFFDMLAGVERTGAEVTEVVIALARSAITREFGN